MKFNLPVILSILTCLLTSCSSTTNTSSQNNVFIQLDESASEEDVIDSVNLILSSIPSNHAKTLMKSCIIYEDTNGKWPKDIVYLSDWTKNSSLCNNKLESDAFVYAKFKVLNDDNLSVNYKCSENGKIFTGQLIIPSLR